jgi:alpha-glucosidase
LLKDAQFRDNPPNPNYVEGSASPYQQLIPAYSTDQPEVHDVVAQMRAVLEEYDERLMIGEIYLPVDRLIDYYGKDGQGAHLPFNFHLISTPWDARELEVMIDRYEGALPDHAWPNWVLGNHDQSRIASRIGPAQARVAAMLLLTLRGTPTIYYADELGMRDVEIPPELAVDVRETTVPGRGLGRDPQRTPMPWNASANAGFTDGRPWLPLAPDAAERSVDAQRSDPRSMLCLYRRLLQLRRSEPALAIGSYAPLPATGSILAFVREHGDRRLAVVLNIGAEPARWPVPEELRGAAPLLSSGRPAVISADRELRVEGDTGLILELPAGPR